MGRREPVFDRLMKRCVRTNGGCLEWNGVRRPSGHGKIFNNGKTVQAHRVAYEHAYGLIPDGMVVCHKCDNPPCCEPTHLFIGTQADNVHDMQNKGRRASFAGEANGRSKLTYDDVERMRTMYAGGVRQVDIAREFGVNRQRVYSIVRNKQWKED